MKLAISDNFKSFGFTTKDLRNLQDHGIGINQLHRQLAHYTQGFPALNIDCPATLGDGICQLDATSLDQCAKSFVDKDKDLTISKFVPASGAASRMFQDLFGYKQGEHTDSVDRFFDQIHRFAFYRNLQKLAELSGRTLEGRMDTKEYSWALTSIMEDLNFKNLPKALIPFHRYPDGVRTALDEHLVEAVEYATTGTRAIVHFTVSKSHLHTFEDYLRKKTPVLQQKYQVDFQVSLSVQHPSTDMVAVSLENKVFRDSNKNVLIRPGGHGALLKNLSAIESDLIYIKNVDNVTPGHALGPMIKYKKVLGGLLLHHQEQIFKYLRKIDAGNEDINLSEVLDYVEGNLGFRFGKELRLSSHQKQTEILFNILNRPVRVCSVIKTDRPTGGGPFWVRSKNNDLSLQIIENAQLSELHNHFEPLYAHITDLVCGVKNFKGDSFNLSSFADFEAGFITNKSYRGTPLKAQEWPGLWNGSMANWNTILLEVPESINHPVKTIWDLLAAEHQPA